MKIFSLPKEPRGLIFDMDNTLYHDPAYSRHQEDVLIIRLADELCIPVVECRQLIDSYRSFFAGENNGRKPSLGNTFLHFGIPIKTSVEWRKEFIRPEIFLKPDPELAKVLNELAGFFCLSVVTNNPVATAEATFKCLGLPAGLFAATIGLDTTGVSKPNPVAFALAAQKMHLDAFDCISIGDRFEIDIEPALSLGMGGVLVEHVTELFGLPGLICIK